MEIKKILLRAWLIIATILSVMFLVVILTFSNSNNIYCYNENVECYEIGTLDRMIGEYDNYLKENNLPLFDNWANSPLPIKDPLIKTIWYLK